VIRSVLGQSETLQDKQIDQVQLEAIKLLMYLA
jgi:hypothetical protein